LARFVYNAFIAISSTYDVHSPKVSNSAIKGSIWASFQTFEYSFLSFKISKQKHCNIAHDH